MVQKFIIQQRVFLINNTQEWHNIATFYKEHEAWEALNKIREKPVGIQQKAKKIDKNIVLMKVTEEILA